MCFPLNPPRVIRFLQGGPCSKQATSPVPALADLVGSQVPPHQRNGTAGPGPEERSERNAGAPRAARLRRQTSAFHFPSSRGETSAFHFMSLDFKLRAIGCWRQRTGHQSKGSQMNLNFVSTVLGVNKQFASRFLSSAGEVGLRQPCLRHLNGRPYERRP